MADPLPFRSLDFSIVDQTMCRHYIRIALCFTFPDPANTDGAIVQVKNGLKTTLERWPHLAGELSLVPNEGPYGRVRHRAPITPPNLDNSSIFSVRMHTDPNETMPLNYEEMASAGMPCSVLPTQLICSLPDSPPLAANSSVWHPVLHVAMNFVAGGMILAVYGAHSVMDGVGLGYFVDVFAENVRATPLKTQSGE
jgi:trichothecene 3-O-acetyltransferase